MDTEVHEITEPEAIKRKREDPEVEIQNSELPQAENACQPQLKVFKPSEQDEEEDEEFIPPPAPQEEDTEEIQGDSEEESPEKPENFDVEDYKKFKASLEKEGDLSTETSEGSPEKTENKQLEMNPQEI
ncbi:unnamed protein product [Blepharisma stoltei]|uniref:Uncharacterized protein n=1 Tax=Blepharisma stoltei TaxID=1481888 RepID=A0AAU9K385_9CILI|nr:unnamed protein product [Blepharisma stoltei]